MITSAQEFKRLRESTLMSEYNQAAHDEAPLQVWEDVVAQMPAMRFWVAQNKTVPIVILEKLSHCEDARVRNMVARKRKINETIAMRLASDSDEGVRAALATNVKLPDAARILLRLDPSPLVQENVARHDAR